MPQSRWMGQLCRRFIAGIIIILSLFAVSAQAQTYQPARIRVAMRGLEERQLLPMLRQLASDAPNAFATRVDLMIAAYELVNLIESGDEDVAGRKAAVDAAFGTYAGSDATVSKPTEGAMAAFFQQQFDRAWKERPEHAELLELRERTQALERRVQDLEKRLGRAPSEEGRPTRDGGDRKQLVVVGGIAAALGMLFLATR